MAELKYKYENLADELNSMIEKGCFPDGKLPGEPELMDKFGVGKITVYNALKKLVDDGHLIRVKGKGTFINQEKRTPDSDIRSQMIAVAIETTGHFYGELHDGLRNSIAAHGYIPVSYNLPHYRMDDLVKNTDILNLLKSGIKGIILHGGGYWREPFLNGINGIKSVFINLYDYDGEPPYSAVVGDYEYGVFDAVSHLAKLSRKKINLFSHLCTVSVKMTESHKRNHPLFQMEKGFLNAIAENGVTGKIVRFNPDDPDLTNLLIKGLLLDKEERPDAIICSFDSIAVKIIAAAEKIGIRVPEDLAVIGIYNTPWCTESPVPLTSISLRPDEMAEKAVQVLLAEDAPEQKIIKIKPELIIRRSSES